jgi:hypothetical protein
MRRAEPVNGFVPVQILLFCLSQQTLDLLIHGFIIAALGWRERVNNADSRAPRIGAVQISAEMLW